MTFASSDNDGAIQHGVDLQPSTSSMNGTSSMHIDKTAHVPLEQRVVPAETSVHCAAQVANIADAQPRTSREDVTLFTSTTASTIQAQLEPRFVSPEASCKCATTVVKSLSDVSAMEHKMTLMGHGESHIETRAEDEFFLVQRTALKALFQDKTYSFIPLKKEDCINHVKKRMETALCTRITKSKKDQPIGEKGGLTQNLI